MPAQQFQIRPSTDRASAREGGMVDLVRRFEGSGNSHVWSLTEEDVSVLFITLHEYIKAKTGGSYKHLDS
jgi:hypothetical protein